MDLAGTPRRIRPDTGELLRKHGYTGRIRNHRNGDQFNGTDSVTTVEDAAQSIIADQKHGLL